MASPDLLAGRLGTRRGRTPVAPRLLAFIHAPTLDAELAAGIRPSTSPAHQLRADRIRRPRVRRRIAVALRRAVEDANRSVAHRTPIAPLSRVAIRRCHSELRALAASVAALEKPPVRGVAIASQLAFDGRGALFFQPETDNGIERLANTIQAARSALRVSAELDGPRPDR